MISDEMKIAIKILTENGFNRDDYQGNEYRDRTGNLNDYMSASEEMFNKWMPVIVSNWPGDPNDRKTKIIAQNIGAKAITTLWTIGHILEID